MEWMDRKISGFMRWCELPVWESLFRHVCFRCAWWSLALRLRVFQSVLALTGVVASPWMMRACQQYQVRLKQRAVRLSAAIRAERPEAGAWRDMHR